MQDTLANLSADFLFPKLHGVWARAVRGAALRQLVQGGRVEELARAVAPFGVDVTRRADFQKDIARHFLVEIDAIRRLLDPRSAAYYAAVQERYFYENLRTVLHHHFLAARQTDLSVLLIEAPMLPAFRPDHLTEARTIHQLFALIPEHPVREALLPVLVELDDKRDMMLAECRLDRMYFASLLAAANGLPHATRAAGARLVRMEIDLINLVIVLRNLALYRLPAETLGSLFIDGGLSLGASELAALTGCTTTAAVFAALPKRLRQVLEPVAAAELYASENVLWNELFQVAIAMFNDYDRPALSIVAFPLLKRCEMLNLARLYEGLHFGLGPADIQEMMIGFTHV